MCSCVFRELVKNGLSDGFGVDPMDKLSTSGPESSPSPHDNSSSSWNNSSSWCPGRSLPGCLLSSPISSGTLNRFSRATIFCLKFRCCTRRGEIERETRRIRLIRRPLFVSVQHRIHLSLISLLCIQKTVLVTRGDQIRGSHRTHKHRVSKWVGYWEDNRSSRRWLIKSIPANKDCNVSHQSRLLLICQNLEFCFLFPLQYYSYSLSIGLCVGCNTKSSALSSVQYLISVCVSLPPTS